MLPNYVALQCNSLVTAFFYLPSVFHLYIITGLQPQVTELLDWTRKEISLTYFSAPSHKLPDKTVENK